jgi:hypothetical protein
VANAKGLAFVDANVLSQIVLQRVFLLMDLQCHLLYVGGGSTDVHPSKGYAIIANKFIEAINMQYGSNLKGVDIEIIEYCFQSSIVLMV